MAVIHFLDLTKSHKDNHLKLFEKLVIAADGMKIMAKNEVCAIKTHFGEDGNINFLHPLFTRRLISMVRKSGASPFLAETTTLYSGRRFHADTHLELAREHGFDFAPIIITDGLFGDEYDDVNGAKIALGFKRVSAIIAASHFKGHMLTGFGAAIKNIGMGCASKGGKLDLHSQSKPYVIADKCTGCLKCYDYCAFKAVKKAGKKVEIDKAVCTGCCGCMSVCPEHAIKFSWSAGASDVQKGIARYTANFIKGRKVFYINFLLKISPECDCFHSNEPLLCPDIGILAGFDPVAIDQASYDMTRAALEKIHPDVDPQEQLFFAEKFGAGERKYEIKTI